MNDLEYYENIVLSKILEFYDNHPFFSMKMIAIIAISMVVVLSSITTLSIFGMDTAMKSVNERHLNGEMTDSEYNNWNNIVVPIFPFMIYIIQIIIYSLLIFAVYFSIRTSIKIVKKSRKK